MANGYVRPPVFNARPSGRPRPMGGAQGFFPPMSIAPEDRGDPTCLFPSAPGSSKAKGGPIPPELLFGLDSFGNPEGRHMSRLDDAPVWQVRVFLKMEAWARALDGKMTASMDRLVAFLSNTSSSVRAAVSSTSSSLLSSRSLFMPGSSSSSSQTQLGGGDLSGIQLLTELLLLNSWAIFIGLAVTILACVAAWFLSPKGENNTLYKSSIILAFASCYIMWAITFLAQLHPLVDPKRSDLRPGYE